MTHDYPQARARMVETQLRARGIREPLVIGAFEAVARHRFVDPALSADAYSDRALPIGCGQTISQPFMTALMTELVRPGPEHRVLEIGTGSGYQAAILSRLVRAVFTIERIAALAEKARAVLADLGISNVFQRVGDGSAGWPGHAPYHGILVTAGAPEIPRSLLAQLADGGRLIAPIGSREDQRLTVIERHGAQFTPVERLACAFVPLIGKEGWNDG
ncbi:MAG: protein-L-isoaspartate(D-aspartate) O-methyltransferase [Candidatus Eisenbacteria bacterium]